MRHGLGHAGEDISNSPYGTNQSSSTLKLFAQVTYVHIEKAIIGRGFAFKECGRNLLTRNDSARGANEHLEQIEFHRSEINWSVRTPHFAGGRVNTDVADGHGFGFRANGGLGSA